MNADNDYPKVLIVNSQSIGTNNATGITMRSLWAKWPKDRVLEICEETAGKELDQEKVRSIKLSPPLLKQVMQSPVGQHTNISAKGLDAAPTKLSRLKISIRQFLVAVFDSVPVKVDPAVMTEIETFAPDVIYTLGGSVHVLNLCAWIAQEMNRNIVIHYMDNWPEHLQWESNRLLIPYRMLLNRALRKCLRFSSVGIAISEAMRQRYTQFFGIDHTVLMNSIDCKEYLALETPSSDSCGAKLFIYAGGLHLGRWKAFLEIAQCLVGTGARFEIYTSAESREKYACLFQGTPVKFCDMVGHDQILQVYTRADVLVHAETDDPLMHGFFKYSISTKIPEYLASGRIVLFYGPEQLGLYQYLNDNHVAICVKNSDELQLAVNQICEDAYDKQMVVRARQIVLERHDKNKAHELLRETMRIGSQ